MLFAPVIHRAAFVPSMRSMSRLLDTAMPAPAAQTNHTRIEQDDKTYTLSLDVPGVSREQLTIGIEGNTVRIETLADAPRQYKAAYELPQDIDAAHSGAKLEYGVLTLTLAKVQPESKITKLSIN